jgi:hypothetical protein
MLVSEQKQKKHRISEPLLGLSGAMNVSSEKEQPVKISQHQVAVVASHIF